MPLLALALHSSFLSFSFLVREQQGRNCVCTPCTAIRRKLWLAPSSPRSGNPGALPGSWPWLAHFWMSFVHMPPVMCSSRSGIGSRQSDLKQCSLLQVEIQEQREGMSKRKSGGNAGLQPNQQPLDTPQEAAAQLAKPVSGSCVPRNGEQHTYGSAGPCHLSYIHVSLFTLGKWEWEASGKKRQFTKPDTCYGSPLTISSSKH